MYLWGMFVHGRVQTTQVLLAFCRFTPYKAMFDAFAKRFISPLSVWPEALKSQLYPLL